MAATNSGHLREFWLPYSAYHLNSTATLLLRCAIETSDKQIKQTCLSNLKLLINRLQRARDDDDWDLADVCLAHCEAAMARIMASDETLHSDRRPFDTRLSGSDDPVIGETVYDSSWGVPWMRDEILEGLEFGMTDLWNNFASGSEFM